MMVSTGTWALLYALELVTVDPGPKLLWAKLEYLGIASAPVMIVLFAARYTRQDAWLSRPVLVLLAIIPICTVVLDWTDEWHGLVHSQRYLDASSPIPAWRVVYGPWFWVHTLYSYVLMAFAALLLLRGVLRSGQLYRWQGATLVAALVIPWIANLLGVTGVSGGLDVTPVGLVLSGMVLAWSQWRRGLLDLVPIARTAIFGAIMDPVLVLDGSTRLMDLNPAAEHTLQLGRSTSIGRHAAALFGTALNTEGPQSVRIGERHFESRPSILKDRRGRTIGYLIMLRDLAESERADREYRERVMAQQALAERTAAEATLRDAEERLRLVLAAAQLGSWEWDLDANTITCSPQVEAMHELPPGAFGGSPAAILSLVNPDDRASLRRFAARLRSSHEPLSLEYRVPWSDGTTHWLIVHGRIFRDNADQRGRVAGVAADATERKAAERQGQLLARGEKLRALGQMANGIAHDLNQSLALISGYAELARHELESASPDREYLREAFDIVVRGALDGGQSVSRLLAFARVQAPAAHEIVEVSELLREVAQLTAPRWRDASQAEGRPISFKVETPHPDLWIKGAPSALREGLTNLVFNAVDALPNGGSIRLASHRAGDNVALEIEDTGVGMPDDVQARLFEPYFTTKGERGTGLGLAQVLAIVQQHAGEIAVSSVPGKGTSIRIVLPSASKDQLRVADLTTISQALRPLHILAVDDEVALATLMAAALRPAGHKVVTANSGEVALELLSQSAFDVVISDLGMGEGMTGWDLALRVRERWPGMRFVLATGWGASIDEVDLRAHGVDAVLSKPYQLARLREVVARLSQTLVASG